MSEVQNPNTNSTQQQQQQQQQSYSDSKINSAESERLYLEMKEAWPVSYTHLRAHET